MIQKNPSTLPYISNSAEVVSTPWEEAKFMTRIGERSRHIARKHVRTYFSIAQVDEAPAVVRTRFRLFLGLGFYLRPLSFLSL